MNKLKLAFLFLLLVVTFTTKAQTKRVFDAQHGVAFEMQDVLKNELYHWPKTLLTYPITFNADIQAKDLILTDKLNNRNVPFQLSDVKETNGKLLSAKVNFIAELPTGGKFSFLLQKKEGQSKVSPSLLVSLNNVGDFIEIGTDSLKIRLPNEATLNAYEVQGPIVSINNGQGWMGNNKVISPNKKVVSIKGRTIEKGDLFVEYELTYQFEGGGEYKTTIKSISGYPFVIFDEVMNKLNNEDNVKFEMTWTNFNPDRRWANQFEDKLGEDNNDVSIPIDKPVYTNYLQEDPHWTRGIVEDPSKEMLFYLLPFAGNAIREQSSHLTFLESGKQGREIGVFVYDFNKWKDYEYGIWQTTQKLAVKFRYTNNVLYWKYPLSTGTRCTAIELLPTEYCNQQAQIVRATLKSQQINQKDILKAGSKRDVSEMSFRYTEILERQYTSLNLNKVKDWQLTYDSKSKRPENPFLKPQKEQLSADEFCSRVFNCPMNFYPFGVNNHPGVHAIEHRFVAAYLIEQYLHVYQQLTSEQRQKVDALLLISAYINSQEDMNAIRNGLSGTANMAADGWCVPADIAFLFPEHPQAKEWLDYFQKEIELNGLFYTRPAVKAYQSKGGRWLESLATYNWAYLRPTSFANISGILFDGKNRYATPYNVEKGKWLSNVVTAPIFVKSHNADLKTDIEPSLANQFNLERRYPAHGAHGGGVAQPPFISAWQIGNWLKYYDPIVAENLFWLGAPKYDFEDDGKHTKWADITKRLYDTSNEGTNPHLKTSKYTGHGLIFRAGVGTDEELSIHLDQVDKGPNYRWGNQGQGGSGSVYFYAAGKVYSGHQNESNGDHSQNNTDGVCNLGFMKNNTFTTIGANDLTAPLFDLGVAQFGQLLSSQNGKTYSWPEYLSRSILTVGTDYFLLIDEQGTVFRSLHRFSWFVAQNYKFPKIYFISDDNYSNYSTAQTPASRGFYKDAGGESIALITHKKDVDITSCDSKTPDILKGEPIFDSKTKRNKNLPKGVFEVSTPKSNDVVFCNEKGAVLENSTQHINGKTGVIRINKDGTQAMSVFYGSVIGTEKVVFKFNHNQLGWSANVAKNGDIDGKCKLLKTTMVTIEGSLRGKKFYLNGNELASINSDKDFSINIPQGEYYWEINNIGGTPQTPSIIRTEYQKKSVKVYFTKSTDIASSRIELSKDGGKTWKKAGDTKENTFEIPAINDTKKVHVRVIALAAKESLPSDEYPVYFEEDKPHFPEGLQLKLHTNSVDLAWGKVLGVSKYRLYRRKKGETTFKLIYEGLENSYTDASANGVIPAYSLPGELENREKDAIPTAVYEYAVSSVNGLGEGKVGSTENTSPSNWLNWYPDTQLKFKRQSAFWLPPYVYEDEVPEKYYPD